MSESKLAFTIIHKYEDDIPAIKGCMKCKDYINKYGILCDKCFETDPGMAKIFMERFIYDYQCAISQRDQGQKKFMNEVLEIPTEISCYVNRR
jgi:hypothetical protein